MANDNKEIGDIVKKCKILLLDIEGTTTSISFVKDKLFPYAEENVKQFLESQWESDDVKQVVTALRKLALEDQENSVEGLVTIPGEDASKEDQIEGLVNNVKWQMSSDRKAGPLKQLQGLIWKQGYDKGDIKGHVYDDVSSALEQWQSVDGQKVYIYSSGSVQAQKLLFGQSLAGDLLPYIEGHFDTAVGAKQEAASYSAIVEKIGCKAEEVLFLTDIVKEAEAARSAGLHVVLVSREGNAPLPSDAAESYTVIHSLGQLSSNKRKTDPQEEQRSKVPKTDVSNDVKTTETETTDQETAVEKKESGPEKMEVEEESTPITDDGKINDNKIEEVIVEEVTDVKDDIPIVEAEPVVIESDETKADNQETEKMETDVTEKVEETKAGAVEKNAEIEVAPENPRPKKLEEVKSDGDKKTETTKTLNVPKENVEVDECKEKEPIAEETPPEIITEIEEITDKENLTEMADIIEDLEPVIEEPNGADDMELQNVGDVLEKECDEILSKVQDVTNLDNIPLKSSLNTIAEETMDTDNLDSNDIMERILDSEELEKKQSEENSAKVAAAVADEKTDKVADNTVKAEEKPDVVEEKTNSVDTKGDDATSAITVNSASDVVKETENTDKETAPEETAKESPKKDEPKPETVIDKEETKVEENSDKPEQKTEETSAETKDDDKVSEEQKPKEVEEPQVNGEATNGEKQSVNQNGDAANEDLSSRLSAENGKEVNGSNGDSMDAENGTDKVKADVADIKVKTVTTEEPQSEPIEQPTEA